MYPRMMNRYLAITLLTVHTIDKDLTQFLKLFKQLYFNTIQNGSMKQNMP